jgi:hypothetical protein
MDLETDIDVGNAAEQDTQGTGWFLGFSPWTTRSAGGLRHVPREQPVTGVCMKWFHHPPGHDSGGTKPLSEGRTLSILVSADAEFVIEFCERADFTGDVRTVVLRREGDFAAWGPGVYHRWRCVRECTVVTLRWNPPQ